MDRTRQHWTPAYLAVAVVLVAITALGATACSTTQAVEPAKTAAPALAVDVVALREGNISQTLSYTGDIKAKGQVAVVPKVAGRIDELRVDVGGEVKAGDVLAVLEHSVLDAQVRQAEAGLAAVKARLAATEAGGRAEVVRQAESNVQAAEARLKQLEDGPTAEQRRVALMNVESAKARLHALNIQKDGDCVGWKPEYLCNVAKANVGAAVNAVDAAQAQYEALVAPPTPEQLIQAQAAVDAAREQVRVAQNPFTAQDLDAARAAVEQAKAGLDLAKLQQKEAYVTAPTAGVVSERFATAGNMASPQAPILTLTSREVEVQVAVEEARIGLVSTGQPVSLAVAAYPGKTFPAVVSSIAPVVDPRTRAIAVKIAPENAGAELKPGMFAQATIVVAQRAGALLVPKEALAQRDGKVLVFVARDGEAKGQEVALGMKDDHYFEVVGGLAGDEQVIVSAVADLVDGMAVAAERK